MEKARRLVSGLLAALLIVPFLAACSDNDSQPGETGSPGSNGTETPETTEAPTTTAVPPELLDELPEKFDYQGYEYVVLTRDYPDSSAAWKVIDIYAESENGSRINDAVFQRNLALEERFNAKVKMLAPDNAPKNHVISAVAADDESFTVVAAPIQDLGPLASDGYLYNLGRINYLDLDKAWWDTEANREMAISGKTYFAGSSATLNTFRATWGTLFNKRLAADVKLPDLYQTVRDGKWTMDVMKQYAKQATVDVNGDGVWEHGVDTIGILLQYDVVYPLFQSAGASAVVSHDDGSFEVTLDSPAMLDAMEKIYHFMHTDENCLSFADTWAGSNKWVEARSQYMDGKFLFFMTHLGTPQLISDMEDDFGILPFPKINEADEYASSFQPQNSFALAVPRHATDPDRTGMLTEAYAMLSYNTVRPAWYDFVLTLQSARDAESGEMLDYIFNLGRHLDIGLAYNGTTQLITFFDDAMKARSFTYASLAAKKKEVLKNNLRTIVDNINNLED